MTFEPLDTSLLVSEADAKEAIALANQVRQLLSRDWSAPA